MNAITMLQNDHRRITKLLREFEDTGDLAYLERQEIVGKVFRELEIHMQAEEEVFYPAVEAAAGLKSRLLVREALAEHEVVRATMNELKRVESDDEAYGPTLELMTEKLEHHIEKEESQMFRAGSKLGDKRLEYLGARIAGLRRMPEESPAVLSETPRQAKKVVTRGASRPEPLLEPKRHPKKGKIGATLRQDRREKSISSSTSEQTALRARSKAVATNKKVSNPRSRGVAKSRGR